MPILKVLERTVYSDYGTALKDNESVGYSIMRRVNISDFAHVGLLVRAHELDISTGGEFEFAVYSEAPSAEDPQLDFISAPVKTVKFDDQSVAPTLMVASLDPTTMGAMIAIGITISRTTTVGALDGTFSMDVHLRQF